jgi:hypothetical protein
VFIQAGPVFGFAGNHGGQGCAGGGAVKGAGLSAGVLVCRTWIGNSF